MAEIQPPPRGEPTPDVAAAAPPKADSAQKRSGQQRGPPLNQIYALPIPIRTFPLPTFYPNNPVSLLHVVYAWLAQVLRPPPAEPAIVHQGIWSPETLSVHILDEKSTRALWEQGFYGKGSLSRSEPSWLKRELVRKGQQDTHVSEILTVQRREERIRAKWERARLEQEAIRQTRLEEARLAEARRNASSIRRVSPPPTVAPSDSPESPVRSTLPGNAGSSTESVVGHVSRTTIQHNAPVCPASILALPNSEAEDTSQLAQANQVGEARVLAIKEEISSSVPISEIIAPVSPANLLALPNSSPDVHMPLTKGHDAPSTSNSHDEAIAALSLARDDSLSINGSSSESSQEEFPVMNGTANGHSVNGGLKFATSTEPSSEGSDETKTSRRGKSVRFSPKVESTTFELFDPPSPNHSVKGDSPSGVSSKVAVPDVGSPLLSNQQDRVGSDSVGIINKEHLQLTPEETFFLAFGIGALKVKDPSSGKQLSIKELFTLFRQHSYFPPRTSPGDLELQPDDKFLVHYCVYHHFRSLGWVPRAGIKFGVDWLLYTRGPVFDHAEFGLIVIPSYSDPLWKEAGKQNPQKTWQWLHGTVRVLSHVTKSLVLVYVDVPSPSRFNDALGKGFSEVFKLYKVREVMVKRWSSNRNR